MSSEIISPDPFPEGCLVLCRTGGPVMTVEKTRSDKFIATLWFDRNYVVQRDAFDPSALLRVD